MNIEEKVNILCEDVARLYLIIQELKNRITKLERGGT